MPYTNFNNTVVLGSVVGWLVLLVPVFLLTRYGVARYRATVGERVRQSQVLPGDDGVEGLQRLPPLPARVSR